MIFLEKLNLCSKMNINIFDILIILIFLFCIISGYRKGLVKELYSFFSFLVSIFISIKMYPIVSNSIRSTSIFENIKIKILEYIKTFNMFELKDRNSQIEFINSLPVPNIISDALNTNNNNEIYKFLDVSGIQNYIVSYLASIICNIISCILVFIIVFIIMRFIFSALNIVANLPVISVFNKSGGIVVGILKGILFSFIISIIYTLVFINFNKDMIDSILDSKIAIYFYENNILLKYLLNILK